MKFLHLLFLKKKIGTNQKPVQWWLEVIAEGTKPLFDEIRNEMATKEDLEQFKNDILNAFDDHAKDRDSKFEKLGQKIDNFDDRVFKALGVNEKRKK